MAKRQIDPKRVRGRPVPSTNVKAFERKLKSWGRTLPPPERAILSLILDRAQRQQPKDYEGLAVRSFTRTASRLIKPYLNHVYWLRAADGGTPDGGWASWAIKME